MITVVKEVEPEVLTCHCHGKPRKTLYVIKADDDDSAIFLCRAGLFDLKRQLHRMTVKERKLELDVRKPPQILRFKGKMLENLNDAEIEEAYAFIRKNSEHGPSELFTDALTALDAIKAKRQEGR